MAACDPKLARRAAGEGSRITQSGCYPCEGLLPYDDRSDLLDTWTSLTLGHLGPIEVSAFSHGARRGPDRFSTG
jgi:hypothetical protein